MAVETVSNYTCDRCGRSELADKVTMLTLTIRPRAGKNVPGLGKPDVSQHLCRENCLKIVKAALTPVNKRGHYDRAASRARRKAITTDTTPAVPANTTNAANTTKSGTKKAHTPRSGTQTALPVGEPTDTRADVVRAVRDITRKPNGGWAKGHNFRTERRMIAERESLFTDPQK